MFRRASDFEMDRRKGRRQLKMAWKRHVEEQTESSKEGDVAATK